MVTVPFRLLAVTAGFALLALAVGAIGFNQAERYFLKRMAEQSQSTLRLAVAGVRGAINRFEPLPALIADKADVKLLLTNPKSQTQVLLVNRQLKQIATNVGASDIYVMDIHGTTLASSNAGTNISFVGRNFSFRPYFQNALKGEVATFSALGTTSKTRGYYIAAPVHFAGKISGVVAVKVGVALFEAAWRGNPYELIVSDDNEIIFLSSRDGWQFKSLQPITPETIVAINTSRRYPQEHVSELPLTLIRDDIKGAPVISIDQGARQVSYIVKKIAMPDVGWNVAILTPVAAARGQAYAVMFTALLLLSLLGVLALYLIQRRARLQENMRVQRQAKEVLERHVAERTADLNSVNKKLVQEIEERTAAEIQLRKTQADLVQAGKLAALGQMSAALSHEFNQPLGAVKSYADNAITYLERDRTKEASENVHRISQLADRMAAISKHLRNFARKPEEENTTVPVATVINDAVEIMSGKLKSSTATVSIDMPNRQLWARAGQVRLQQVLVNLISNALDAMKSHTSAPLVEISVREEDGRVLIDLRDHGPGLKDDVMKQMFDPFFTTKQTGQGLGLGLSISYNIVKDFGGHLSARNHPDGGAVFSVDLAAAEAASGMAAE